MSAPHRGPAPAEAPQRRGTSPMPSTADIPNVGVSASDSKEAS